MPKLEIDYSNTIIYKITCIEPNITDVYVGHTTNFVQRKHAHKQSCTNQNIANYKCKLYEVIRNNGGWKNWKMEIINFYNCHDHYEARKKEQEYFISLNATLNSIEPLPKPKPKPEPKESLNIVLEKEIFYCDKCNINCHSLKLFEIHNETKKHNKTAITNESSQNGAMHELCKKNVPKYCCIPCDYNTSKKSSYVIHLTTPKHTCNDSAFGLCKKNAPKFYCKNCDYNTSRKSSYDNHILSLRHKKANEISEHYTNNNLCEDGSTNQISGELVIELLKQNNEFKELLKDQNKQMMEQNKYFIENQNKQTMEQNKQMLDQNKHIIELMENSFGFGSLQKVSEIL